MIVATPTHVLYKSHRQVSSVEFEWFWWCQMWNLVIFEALGEAESEENAYLEPFEDILT